VPPAARSGAPAPFVLGGLGGKGSPVAAPRYVRSQRSARAVPGPASRAVASVSVKLASAEYGAVWLGVGMRSMGFIFSRAAQLA